MEFSANHGEMIPPEPLTPTARLEHLHAHIETFKTEHGHLPDSVHVGMDFYFSLPRERLQEHQFQAEGDDVVYGHVSFMEIPIYYLPDADPSIIYSPIREAGLNTSDPFSEYYEPPDNGEGPPTAW